MNQQKRYLAYLLRLWQESAGDLPGGDLPGGDLPGGDLSRGEAPLWRASLERPQSDQRQGFASLARLFAFLENETQSSLPGSQDSEEEGR